MFDNIKFSEYYSQYRQEKYTTGIEITRPYINVFPRSALKAPTKNIGPGCGGKKQWVVLKPAAIGIAIYNKGSFAVRAIEKINGTRMIKPAL